MLICISSLDDYKAFLHLYKTTLDPSQLKRLKHNPYRSALHKFHKLDPALAEDILTPLYSSTGRPAHDPAVLIRSFLLMMHLGILSIDNWAADLASDSLLQYLIGSFSPPSAASHYDFINRLTHSDPHMNDLHPKDFYKKPDKKKPADGQKLINFSKEDTHDLLDRYKNGAESDRSRMIYTLQLLFTKLAVIPSADTGFIDSSDLVLSGDGSSMHAHASPFGHKVLKDRSDEDNTYRFSAPDADIGWDSDKNEFYLGYTFYSISYHNPCMQVDLPVYITLEKASRHDALTSISAPAQFFDLDSGLHPKYMCLDSASDSGPIYQYYRLNHVIPLIDHNQRGKKDKTITGQESINIDGIPVCSAGIPMYYDGYDLHRERKKYRCPLKMGRIDHCPYMDVCPSTSAYGRVRYVSDHDDVRNAGPISYRSDEWKKLYNNRTSCERVNTRVLNDYHLHQMKIRNGSKHAFFSIFAGINIHLDAWIKNES